MAFSGNLQAYENLGQQAWGGLEDLGPHVAQCSQQFAVLDDFGLTTQTMLDMVTGITRKHHLALRRVGQQLGDAVTPHVHRPRSI